MVEAETSGGFERSLGPLNSMALLHMRVDMASLLAMEIMSRFSGGNERAMRRGCFDPTVITIGGHHNLPRIPGLPRQHQLSRQRLFRSHGMCSLSLQLLHSVRIPQSIQSMLTARFTGRHIGDHSGATIPNKGILKHLGELAPSKGSVALVLIQSANALFQS